MSHWTRAKTKIKDLQLLKRLAEEKGCTVDLHGEKSVTNRYAGATKAVGTISYGNGEAYIVEQSEDEYGLQLDNYMNPVVEAIGRNGDDLLRDYTCELAKEQAVLMGGVVTDEKVLRDGSVEITVSI